MKILHFYRLWGAYWYLKLQNLIPAEKAFWRSLSISLFAEEVSKPGSRPNLDMGSTRWHEQRNIQKLAPEVTVILPPQG